jgi:hypothetical protein
VLPRQAEAPGQRRLLAFSLSSAAGMTADIDRLRGIMTEFEGIESGPADGAAGNLALWTGDWADARWGDLERQTRTGNRFAMIGSFDRQSLIASLSGDDAAAARSTLAALEIVADQIVALEAGHRGRLAISYAHLSRVDEAEQQLDRARRILPQNDGWDAARGALAAAEAVVDSASGRQLDAERRFAQSHQVLTRIGSTLLMIQCLVEWGRARLATGDAAGAVDRLDAAAGVLERVGAGAA